MKTLIVTFHVLDFDKSCHVLLFGVTFCHVVACRVVMFHVVACRAVMFHVVKYGVVFGSIVPCHAAFQNRYIIQIFSYRTWQ